jgi:RES domain-containing protein
VNLKPNPCYDSFVAQLKKAKRRFVKWEGIAFRSTPLEFARIAKLLDGRGSLKFGGRWSAAGTFRAVNMSLTQETAVKESSANFTYYNFAADDVRPKVLIAVRLKLRKVIDITNPKGIRKQTWLQFEELISEDWRKVNDTGKEAQTQAFGRAAHDIGAEALLVSSARVQGGLNLIYFPESVLGHGRIAILGKDELERWLKKR